MALYILALGCQDDVCEVLVVEEPGEHPQHVVLVVVPLEAVLLLLLHPHGSRYHAHRRKCLSLEQKY